MTKYGIFNFKLDVLAQTNDKNQIDNLEIYWISFLKEKGYVLYNCDIGGKVLRGENHHMYGKKHSAETKALIGAASKGRPCHWGGKKLSTEVKSEISSVRKARKLAVGEKNPSAKLTLSQVEEIRTLIPFLKYKEIASKYGVSIHAIQRIKSGSSWK